jgi:hypothetical protein
MKTAQRKVYKNMTEKDFAVIKQLQTFGLKQQKIMQVTGRGAGTVMHAQKSETFDEYKKRVATQTAKYNKPVETPAVSENIFSNRGGEKELTVAEVLLEINANLCRLVEAWERSPKK